MEIEIFDFFLFFLDFFFSSWAAIITAMESALIGFNTSTTKESVEERPPSSLTLNFTINSDLGGNFSGSLKEKVFVKVFA